MRLGSMLLLAMIFLALSTFLYTSDYDSDLTEERERPQTNGQFTEDTEIIYVPIECVTGPYSYNTACYNEVKNNG